MSAQAVLILDNFPQTLAVIRSLSQAGFRTILGRNQGQGKSEFEFSRHTDEVWIHPDYEDAEAFDAALAKLIDKRTELAVIFPVATPSIRALMSAACLKDRPVEIAMVRGELFTACVEKLQANALASRAHLRVPNTVTVYCIEELLAAATSIGFPLIIKSPRTAAYISGRKAYVVHTPAEFAEAFAHWPKGHRDLLVQEYIEGTFETCDFVASSGRLVGYLQARVARTDAFDGTGGGVEFESIPPTMDVLQAISRFVEASEYSGPGVIQFIRQEHTDELFFVENNPRLAACVAHTIQAGVDCPLLTLQATTNAGHAPPNVDIRSASCKYHYRLYWLQRDLISWMSSIPEFKSMGNLDWIRLIVRSLRKSDGDVFWDWRDPVPAILVYTRCFARLLRSQFRQLLSGERGTS